MRISDWSSDVCSSDLVGARRIIGARRLDRIAGVAQIDEIDALHHAPVSNVEAGDDADADGHLLPSHLWEGLGEGLLRERTIVTCPPLVPPASGRGTNDRDSLGQIEPPVVERPPGNHPFDAVGDMAAQRSEEHTSELQSLMRTSYA